MQIFLVLRRRDVLPLRSECLRHDVFDRHVVRVQLFLSVAVLEIHEQEFARRQVAVDVAVIQCALELCIGRHHIARRQREQEFVQRLVVFLFVALHLEDARVEVGEKAAQRVRRHAADGSAQQVDEDELHDLAERLRVHDILRVVVEDVQQERIGRRFLRQADAAQVFRHHRGIVVAVIDEALEDFREIFELLQARFVRVALRMKELHEAHVQIALRHRRVRAVDDVLNEKEIQVRVIRAVLQRLFDRHPIFLVQPFLVAVAHQQEIADEVGVRQGEAGGVDALENDLRVVDALFELDEDHFELAKRDENLAGADAAFEPCGQPLADELVVQVDVALVIHFLPVVFQQEAELLPVFAARAQLDAVLWLAVAVVEVVVVDVVVRVLRAGRREIHQRFQDEHHSRQALLAVDDDVFVHQHFVVVIVMRQIDDRAEEMLLARVDDCLQVIEEALHVLLRPIVIALVHRDLENDFVQSDEILQQQEIACFHASPPISPMRSW